MSLDRASVGESPRFLLLLPPPPPSSTPALSALKAVYGQTISDVLKEVASHSPNHPEAVVLEIGLACPHLIDSHIKSRASLYEQTQAIVAGLYRLIVATASRDGINVEDADGVDVRVILVAWAPEGAPQASARTTTYGPVIDMETLARSGRPWQFAFGVESEPGVRIMQDFVTAKANAGGGERVSNVEPTPVARHPAAAMGRSVPDRADDRHYDVIVGGTWDHLHIGHKLLVTMVLFAVDPRDGRGERSANFGITGDQLLVNKKHAHLVEKWEERQRAIATFSNAIIDFSQPATPGQRHVSVTDDPGPNGKSIAVHYPHGLVVRCTEIQDPYGPTITLQHLTALIISAETRSGGKAVNEKRKELGWKELQVFEVDVLDAAEAAAERAEGDEFAGKISSTAIREKLAKKTSGKM